MNLVKAQEYAQSLPLAELKKYADGLNPSMIPPWLATGEMQAKTKRAEMANAMQGAAQGEQPSVKEQVEQKAGLLGLQQAQQGAQQQAMMQPRPMAGPVPTGTPQPQAQPQARPQPPRMAGLDQLTSNIQMAGGGIVAFAGKGPSKVVNPDAGLWKWLDDVMGITKEEFINNTPQKVKNEILQAYRSTENIAPPPSAQAAPTPQTVQGSASPKAFAAGQAMRPAMAAAKDIAKTKLLPGANVGLAAYEGLSDISGAKDFYDDPNVSMADKAKQFARTGVRTALPIAGGTAGSFVAPVAGTIGGAAVGQGLAALIDQEGDALKKYRESQKGDMASENARLAAKAPAPASDMGNEGRRTGQVAMGNGINVSPNLIPASARPKPQGNVPQNVNPNAVKVNPNAPAVSEAPAAPVPDSMDALFREALKKESPQRSVESLIAEDQDIKKRLGLDEPAGKNKLDRIADIKQQYAATQLSPMDELIAMLGKSGQSKGLSGLAPAYTSMAEKKRAADLAHAERINELMGGVEDTQRGEKTASATGVRTAREKDVENARLRDREVMSSTGTARGQDITAASSKYQADMHYKQAMAQIRATASREGMQQQRLLLDTFKAELATIDKDIAALMKNPFLKESKEQLPELRARKAGLTKALDEASGISKMLPAPGAASPGGTNKPGWGIKPI
jgi:hypothetical protein